VASKPGIFFIGALAAGIGISGCSLPDPTDPEDTLAAVTDGTLRVGVTDNEQWVQLPPAGEPRGIEPELVRGFASRYHAQIQWAEGSEASLVDDLKHGDLDLVIGGLADDTPWSKDAGMTRPYLETQDERGKTVKHVMLIRHGENAFLVALDRFLLEAAAA
jgi:hypothetical protein